MSWLCPYCGRVLNHELGSSPACCGEVHCLDLDDAVDAGVAKDYAERWGDKELAAQLEERFNELFVKEK